MKSYHKFLALGTSLCLLLTACGEDSSDTTPPVESQPAQSTDSTVNTETNTTPESENTEINETPSTEDEPVGDAHFGMFIAETTQGVEVSDRIFNDYDLTMVNIWATWCGPCVEEMPYLEEVYTQLPEGVNMITICQDGDTNRDLAENILNTSGATFTTILPSESLNVNVFSKVSAFPTTLFVDKNGNVATYLTGAPPSNVAETYLSYIDQILPLLEEMET